MNLPRPGAPVAFADVDRSADWAWSLCVAIARLRKLGEWPALSARFRLDDQGRLLRTDACDARAAIDWLPAAGWSPVGTWEPQATDLFDLYRPLCDTAPGQRLVIGHLGQSIDGRIATQSGDACFVNGRDNLVHLHRMRALCDAVLVGAETVQLDNPRLTTRLVPGDHPARIVLDPAARLASERHVFQDGQAPTLVVRAATVEATAKESLGNASVLGIAASQRHFDLAALLEELAGRGLCVLFVEGGGVTVSRFLQHGCLDRLQLAIAPVIIGSGREGLRLPEVRTMRDCLRPRHRIWPMGDDMLWDFDLRD